MNMTDKLNAPLVEDGAVVDEGDESVTEIDVGHILMRPDGYHWQTPDGKQEFGPFESLEAALADMQLSVEENAEPGETLQEAEDELGVSDWIDPDTGGLAEGQSTPHLSDE
jgi:hypothetical protein